MLVKVETTIADNIAMLLRGVSLSSSDTPAEPITGV